MSPVSLSCTHNVHENGWLDHVTSGQLLVNVESITLSNCTGLECKVINDMDDGLHTYTHTHTHIT